MDESPQADTDVVRRKTKTRSRARTFAIRLTISLIACGLLALWIGSNRLPAVATTPLSIHGQQRASELKSETLRIGTYNIHGGVGLDGIRDLNRIATNLQGVDVAGLYEVHSSFFSNQAYQIADRMELAACFAATERRWWHDHFGNGLLTRVNLKGLVRIPLPGTQGKKFRNAILASVPCGRSTIHILAVHLDRVQDRERQLRIVIQMFLSLEAPAVLMGDLNTRHDDPQLAELLARDDVDDALLSIGVKSAEKRIDWLLMRGLRCEAAELHDNPASDHPAITATVRPLKWNRVAEVERQGTD